MADELSKGQIRPAAQPLSSFLEPTRRQVAAPAGLLEIPRVPELRVIQQGSPGDVQGFNQFQQMAQALAPFNQALTQLAGAGLVGYANEEMQRGRNEALRAKALLDAQQQQSAEEYAAENRKLAQVDPIGALMMDAVNPFRRGGRLRALGELAALEAKGAVISEYRSATADPSAYGGQSPELWQEGDPRLAEVKSRAINNLRSKYKIDESTPGFERILAQANEGADRVTEMQWQDRQRYLKSTVPGTVAAEALGLYAESVSQQSIVVYRSDGSPETITAGDPRWDAARIQRMTDLLDQRVREMGLPGEATEVKLQVVQELLAIADAEQDDQLKRLAKGLMIGPRDKNGIRAAAEFFSPTTVFDSEIKYGELGYKRAQREREQLASQYQDLVIQETNRLPDGPERLDALERIRGDKRFADLPLNQKLELEQKTSKTIDEVNTLGRSVEPASALLLDMGSRYGTAWNSAEADAEFERAVAQAPDDQKPALRRQYADLRERNNRREAAPTTREVNTVIEGKIRANLRANYASNATEAALRNANFEAVIAGLEDANAKEAARRQYSAYQGYVRSKIAAEEAEKGRPLTAARATEISTQAVDEYGKNDPKQKAYLFPGVDGQPGVQRLPVAPAPAAPAGGGGGNGAAPRRTPPGTKPFTGRVYPSGQLDNIPDRSSRVSGWRDQPTLDAASTVQEVNRIISGGSPSAALRRFARDAGVTPGQLLNKHLDFYSDSIKITPAERQKLQRDGRQAQAVQNSARSASVAQGGPVQRAQRSTFDRLMGLIPAGPAAAATMPPPRASQRQGLVRGSVSGGVLPVGQIAVLARSAGFSGEEAAIMAAIAMAESSGRSTAHNPNASTGDNSYGLWQVNMLGAMGPQRLREFGIRRNEDLFDPATNAMAARKVYQSQGFKAWSVYRSGAYRQYLPAARRALFGR